MQAAVVSVKIAQHISSEISGNKIKQIFWADTTAALGYIANEDKKIHTYVANRIQIIRNHTEQSQWHYVRSNNNPADIASRTCDVADLTKVSLNSPDFLYNPALNIDLCVHPNHIATPIDDPEVRSVVNLVVTVQETQAPFGLYDRLQNISE